MTTAAVLGDSVLGAAPYSWASKMAARLGWTATLYGAGGTGYTAGGANDYPTRLATLLAAGPYDVVVVEGSSNDKPNDAAEVAALSAIAADMYADIVASGSRLIVVGLVIQDRWLVADPRFVTGQAALADAASAAGGTYINPSAETWITGTGYAGAEQGDGNGDVYMADDFHLSNPAGHDYLGTRLAFAIAPPATGLDY